MDTFTEDNHGLAESVRINMENAARFQPGLATNPVYQIAMDQLLALCGRLADGDSVPDTDPRVVLSGRCSDGGSFSVLEGHAGGRHLSDAVREVLEGRAIITDKIKMTEAVIYEEPSDDSP